MIAKSLIEAARERAAQCWCDERVSERTFDPELAEVFAEVIVEYMRAVRSEWHIDK
jgi:hypothetical protein